MADARCPPRAGDRSPAPRGPPLRVLLTAYGRFPNALAWHALQVARGLTRRGHDVLLFCQRESPLAEWARAEAFALNRDYNLHSVNPRDVLGGLAALRRALNDFRPDVLNPHCAPGHSFLALARAQEKLRVPLIRTVADPRHPNRNLVNVRLHRTTTDGMIFTTRSSLARYEAILQGARAEIRVILPGLQAAEFLQGALPGTFRQQYSLREDQLLVGSIARMAPEKGQEVLLEALALLSDAERARVFCVIAGDDSPKRGRAELQAVATRLGVEQKVAFPGRLPDVRSLMNELDLAIITSLRSEAVCRVALEYMSFGVPVLASDVNILPEVVRDGENGGLFPAGDAAALAARLREAIAQPELRRRWGEAGAALVRGPLSLEHELDETAAFYDQLATR